METLLIKIDEISLFIYTTTEIRKIIPVLTINTLFFRTVKLLKNISTHIHLR